MNKKIVVTGATGQQGGSVVAALLQKDFDVYAVTRNAQSQKAQELGNKNVTVLEADMNQTDSLHKAFRHADALFLVGTPFETGTDGEVRQGINAIKAAKEAGIKFIVYTSVAAADKNTGIPHFDSKFAVEQFLAKSGIAHAIIAPAFFYDNIFAQFMLPGLKSGTFAQALPADIKLHSVSVKNIGEFAGLIFSSPDRFSGKRINLAEDAVTGTEFANIISDASGSRISYFEVPIENIRSYSEDMALMYTWFKEAGYDIDTKALQQEYPEIKWQTFAEWAKIQDWSVLKEAAIAT